MHPTRIDKPGSPEHGPASAAGPLDALDRGHGVRVSGGSDPYRGIVEAARLRLANTPFPVVREVVCHYEHGVLTLRGRLPSFYLKSVAQEAVRSVLGVRQVVNQIEVVT